MARVKYPFIVKYGYVDKVLFAREPDEEVHFFQQVPDQLEATIYHNLKEFKSGFTASPTAWLEKMREFEGDGQFTELVYVGE